VTAFPSLCEPFDPERHEAIGGVESGQHAPGTVVEEVQRGYRWGEELLRPARVRVAR
jgi:molecular chaperone GrpE